MREEVSRGGAFLALRQGVGALLGALSLLLVARVIGPEAYGTFALGLATGQFVHTALGLGLGAYLVRAPTAGERHRDTAFVYLLLGAALSLTLAPLLALITVQVARLDPGAFWSLTLLYAALPLQLLGGLPLSFLERRLDYRFVALGENLSQFLGLLVAAPLAHAGLGALAPTLGFLTQQGVLAALAWWRLGEQPRAAWDREVFREMAWLGVAYSLNAWLAQARLPVALALVGRALGAEAVGSLALALRLVEYATLFKVAVQRVSLAVLGRLQAEPSRFLRALEEATLLQTLAIWPPLLLLVALFPWLGPLLFPEWRALEELLPLLGVAQLLGTPSAFLSLALAALGRGWDLVLGTAFSVGFSLLGYIFFLPRMGWGAVGVAEAATALGFPFLYRAVAGAVGHPCYRLVLGWTLVGALSVAYPLLGPLALVPLGIWLFLPASRPTWGMLLRLIAPLWRR
ncbi:oligosaccharide flippase family protein [Thermus caldilimi]|uniref:oligosaccharide flippase family protein n=1 Tax=Thermus caldilimi TaxID=2483360 RepID=UPI00107624E8|nr:oligosaccharide flippase family protein [Thermus caldilimi]